MAKYSSKYGHKPTGSAIAIASALVTSWCLVADLTAVLRKNTKWQEKINKKGIRLGVFCIATGCSNAIYKTKDRETPVHFHKLPLKRSTVLGHWLAVIKSEDSTSQQKFAVTIFVHGDYVWKRFFNKEGKATLGGENVVSLSVFDFSDYNL